VRVVSNLTYRAPFLKVCSPDNILTSWRILLCSQYIQHTSESKKLTHHLRRWRLINCCAKLLRLNKQLDQIIRCAAAELRRFIFAICPWCEFIYNCAISALAAKLKTHATEWRLTARHARGIATCYHLHGYGMDAWWWWQFRSQGEGN